MSIQVNMQARQPITCLGVVAPSVEPSHRVYFPHLSLPPPRHEATLWSELAVAASFHTPVVPIPSLVHPTRVESPSP